MPYVRDTVIRVYMEVPNTVQCSAVQCRAVQWCSAVFYCSALQWVVICINQYLLGLYPGDAWYPGLAADLAGDIALYLCIAREEMVGNDNGGER